MNTKILMTLASAWLALVGLALSFAPQEFLAAIGAEPGTSLVTIVQILGAAYLGFAYLNWTARANLIGGIYSKPVTLGNLLHFLMVAAVFVKLVINGHRSIETLVLTAIYVVLAAAFIRVTFGNPLARRRPGNEESEQ